MDIESELELMQSAHNAALKSEHEMRLAMQTAINNHIIQGAALDAIQGAGGCPELLLAHVTAHLKISDTGSVVVVGSDGYPRVGNDSGDLMTAGQFVETLKSCPTYGRTFRNYPRAAAR